MLIDTNKQLTSRSSTTPSRPSESCVHHRHHQCGMSAKCTLPMALLDRAFAYLPTLERRRPYNMSKTVRWWFRLITLTQNFPHISINVSNHGVLRFGVSWLVWFVSFLARSPLQWTKTIITSLFAGQPAALGIIVEITIVCKLRPVELLWGVGFSLFLPF